MKKILTIAIIAILFATFTSCSAQTINTQKMFLDDWTGTIRIEGSSGTVFNSLVTFGETDFEAENVNTGITSQYHIGFPSVLGALIEASEEADFTVVIEYWPDWDAFLVKTINGESDWWHYWVDYEVPMVGASTYKLTSEDTKIIWGYVESWDSHALLIDLDKSEVKKNEEFTVTVTDEIGVNVENALVYVGASRYFLTDSQGVATITIPDQGNFVVYAEKDGYVRSETDSIQVKTRARSANFMPQILAKLFEKFPAFEFLLKL